MKSVLSGIQPTGNLHLGNYLGSIRNWVNLQNEYRCVFGVMNLHAITLPQDPRELKQSAIDAAAVYLACGLDPKKSTIFIQSEVSAHAELAWVLGCLTPMGWLDRMTQFKEKTKTEISENKNASSNIFVNGEVFDVMEKIKSDAVKSKANLGLYAYPVLMAADILAYKADLVPVGEDQKQHLELTRDLAGAFNRKVGREYFKLPEPLIIKETKRIMSLQDGTKKMSKSDESDLSRINLNDSAENIVKKLKKAKTDSQTQINYDENRPEIYNLLNIFAAFSGKAPQEIAKEYENAGYGKFKGDLAEIVVEKLRPIQYNIERFKKEEGFVLKILEEGRIKAGEIANETKNEVFELMGL